MARILIFGSRHWKLEGPIDNVLCSLDPARDIVIHGNCAGADSIAKRIANSNGIHDAAVDALWTFARINGHWAKAGPDRNAAMHLLQPDRAFGFRAQGRSNGTDQMTNLCYALGVPLSMVYLDKNGKLEETGEQAGLF